MVSVFDFKTGEVEDVFPIEHKIPHTAGSIAVSPDGQWLLFTQREGTGSDIMLVENFR
jgi:hypothetical protein